MSVITEVVHLDGNPKNNEEDNLDLQFRLSDDQKASILRILEYYKYDQQLDFCEMEEVISILRKNGNVKIILWERECVYDWLTRVYISRRGKTVGFIEFEVTDPETILDYTRNRYTDDVLGRIKYVPEFPWINTETCDELFIFVTIDISGEDKFIADVELEPDREDLPKYTKQDVRRTK